MKKFALVILSVFVILAGVLLSACDKKVSLSVSDTEVVLYTNYENGENNKSKDIEVELKNSNAGINVEVVYGQDCINLQRSNVSRKKANGKYGFKILTKDDKNSGVAQLKVSALDDSKQYKYINITVNTVVEELKTAGQAAEDGKSNLFVVKGIEKELVSDDYFDLLPVYANITDIDWTFENGEKELFVDGTLAAKVEGNSLKVFDSYSMRRINILATYQLNRDISRVVTLEVLEDSTIQNYSVEDNVFYRNGNLETTAATVALKRNNSNLSTAEGVLVLDVSEENELRLKPVVYKRENGQAVLLDSAEYEKYFIFDYSERDNVTGGTKTYNFTFDAIDNNAKNIFGQFEIYLQVDYAKYNYSVSTTSARLVLDIAYSATIVELSDEKGYSINNTFQDVFSSYENTLGYQVNTVIGPTDVAIDDRYFRITIDTNQTSLKNLTLPLVNPVAQVAQFFTADGTPLQFTQSASLSNIFVTEPIETGTKLYVKGSDTYDVLDGVEFKFESRSNASVNTSLYFTFYKIAEDKNLGVVNSDGSALENVQFLSSSVYSSRKLDFAVKISGISTVSGLELCNDGVSGFEYSNLTLLSKSEDNADESFVVVSFSATLTAYNFADTSTFWFEHITGKKSAEFKIETFVPIESLTIQNSDKSSANVYIDNSQAQNYVLENENILNDTSRQSYSLSKLMLEAGTSLPLYTAFQNATLTENGISYRFMSFDKLKVYLSILNGITDSAELDRLANELLASGELDAIANANAFMHFDTVDAGYFSISKDMLTVSNRPFKGFVAVLVEGYDEEHNTVTVARFFALESFYSVRFLSSNVRTTLLYTTETLSLGDINRSIVDVTLSMRQDDNIPTYSNSLDYFTFVSGLQDFYQVTDSKTMWKNDYYTISNVMISNNGRNLTFRITANSTKLQTSVKDVLKVVYLDEHGFEKTSEIQIEIRNVKRLESVQWVNKTADNEIYLNLTTTNTSEKNFTISTSVEPSDANDIGLTSLYVASSGSSSDIKISTSSIGQIFNVNINTNKGGRGYLYLLPNDMVKNVDGFNHILVYKYVEEPDGSLTEIPVFIPLSSLGTRYDELIAGSDEISNYFFNGEGEKVYYRNIILKILITIADGSSEGTAIRVYNQGDLEEIDYAKYYRVMNDITLSGWKSYSQFSGMLYGNSADVTLKFTNGSESFVNNLTGTIKDLTFVGEATVSDSANAGFIANVVGKTGKIENCVLDVYYANAEGSYYGSKLNSSAIQNTGAVAGQNEGTISNTYAYGTSIRALYSSYVGGLVGENNGHIENSGFEFYKFENDEASCNSIESTKNIGGIVGFAGSTSVVTRTYVYAYALPMVEDAESADDAYSTSNIIKTEGFVGVLAGGSSNGAKFVESFGFIGDASAAFASSDSDQYVTLENSYITFFAEGVACTNIYKLVTYSYANAEIEFVNGTQSGMVSLTDADDELQNAQLQALGLDENVWNLQKTDGEINFGYIYLLNVAQSTAVELDDVHAVDVQGDYDGRLRVLNSGKKVVGSKEYETGILFMFNPVNTISDVQEKAMLERLNTISISSLFGLSSEQARSLLLTSESKNISISANSIKILNTTANEFEINVHSKMDFTQVKTFKFVIMNVLPTLSTMIDGISIKDEQIILLQTGASRTVVYSTLSSVYLDGNTLYALNKDNFTINHTYIGASDSNDYVGVTRSSNSIVLTGLKKHQDDNRTTIYTNLSHNVLSANTDYTNYANAVNDKISRTFDVRVYNGAKKLEIANANNLIVRPSEYATFEALLETDEETDDLVFGLSYGQVEVSAKEEDNLVKFDVDSNLSLEISWTKTSSTSANGVIQNKYRVLVKISEDKKHLIDEEYSALVLSVNASSQSGNTTYLRKINLKVETQKLEDFSISTYAVERRQIRNSILYLTPSSNILNTLSPASDAIVSVSVTPQFAKMTHFTLTYEVSGSAVGTVGLSKLVYNPMYGYYVNSNSATVTANGVRVNITDSDKTGDGLFYFRLYISSSFVSTSGLRLVTTFYNGNEVLATGSQTLTVDYMQDAVVRVNDATTYLLAKGESATVTVRVGIEQTLYDLYLQNNEAKITLTTPTVEVVGNYKVYTAQISAGVDAKLVGGQDSGIFYVCASVERMLNNIQEIKTSRATLCLVDFSIDAKGISVVGSGNKRSYNGRTYDVFNAYINDSSELHFNYPVLPTEYNYNKNDSDEVKAVEALTARREQFLNYNYYYDDKVGYYINYLRDDETGLYNPITLKQQLWYATDETHSTAIYNANRNTITQNDYFSIDEETLVDGSSRINISGKRAGTQLMKLRTVINYQGIELVNDYYFLVVVEVWTDEESPTQISTAQEFIDYATNSEEAADYILMNDIVLSDYTPISTSLLNSLDGNGFTIHINSFKMTDENSLRLALFTTVTQNTTLKNVRVNIYNGGQISVNIKQYTSVEIAGFALTNEGVIYNCEVVSYYDEKYQIAKNTGNSGLVVKYTNGANSSPIALTYSMNVESRVSGFVLENNASIMNSRVGGESFKHITQIDGTNYLQSKELEVFYLEGQGEVSGFVNSNTGYISASFVKNIQIDNIMQYDSSITAGFVVSNNQSIQNSYVEGLGGAMEEATDEGQEPKEIVYNNLTNISSLGVIAGFVYENNSLVKNSYSNIAIENSKTKGSMVAGFVYRNNAGAQITLCYSACQIAKSDITQMQFSGVDDFTNSLNYGEISLSYFYNDSRVDDTIQSKVSTSAIAVFDVAQKNSFYGFSFSSEAGAYNGIWEMRDNGKITLVGANQIAVSNRYASTNGKVTSVFYSRSIRDVDTMKYVDLSYGSETNPIILRNASDFAKATGKATTTEISSYKEYYTENADGTGEVTGRYRIVNNIDMNDIAQDAEDDGSVKLTTTRKTFRGLLDGNGFTISNISLGSSIAYENFGLFARLDGAVIMNLDLTVESVHDAQANIVGVLAGTAVDTRMLAITLSPSQANASGESTAVQGHNVVGGVVGMLFGESYLSDISVSNVDVSSEGYKEGKDIHYNNKYIEGNGDSIKSLRELVADLDNGVSLNNGNVENLSYAGAIAGYIDTYTSRDEGFVSYSTSREVGDYDVVTVRVSDSVNIYAEVAGGLFGYVGKSTLIYDATLTLNQNMSLSTQGVNPSYIISKNMFAGGLVGENYGGLFAVSATYEKTLQNTIEENEHRYYAQSAGVEKGQQSIFSYTPNDDGFSTRTNKPLFVGGLVGFMGGGYIYVGVSKLNVIAHSDGTVVGGVVGLSGLSSSKYDLNFTTEKKSINALYYEVYASGDVYADNGISSGIIGAVEADNSSSAVVAMKNVMAMNYRSFSGKSLMGDKNAPVENVASYISDRHYMLVGGIYKGNTMLDLTSRLSSDFLIINSTNDIVLNLKDGSSMSASMGAFTVGGYKELMLGNVTAILSEFGFTTPASNIYVRDGVTLMDDAIVKTQHIGHGDLASMTSAYARMKNYFISNGWDEKYWSHTQDRLFPDIVLLPKTNILFWDVYNTAEVLAQMNDSSNTIVVRGRTLNDENDWSRQDINLNKSEYKNLEYIVETFRGRLVSYESYMNGQEGGKVTTISGGTGSTGGEVGDRVGIILNNSLFKSLSGNASIEGLTFYLCNDNENNGYSIISEETETSLLRNVNVVVNNNMTLTSSKVHTDEVTSYKSIGLITGIATSTSFYNISVRFRNDANIVFSDDQESSSVYMGLLAGKIRQSSAHFQMTVNGVSIYRVGSSSNSADAEQNPITLKFNTKVTEQQNIEREKQPALYAGVYAGEINKTSTASLTLGVRQINNVNMEIESQKGAVSYAYVGGYAGVLRAADKVDFVEGERDSDEGLGISICQNVNIDEFYAGLAFGENRTNVNFSFEQAPRAWLIGRVIQKNGISATIARIGSVAGISSGAITLSSIRVKFDVARAGMFNKAGIVDFEQYNASVDALNENKYSYGNMTPFEVGENEDNSIGGIVGYASGSVTVAGVSEIRGSIIARTKDDQKTDKITPKFSVGGAVGKFVGSNTVVIGGTIANSLNMYLVGEEVYAGGMVGWFAGETSITEGSSRAGRIEIGSAAGNLGAVRYTGSVVGAEVKKLIFGGAVGKLVTDASESLGRQNVLINKFAFGGALKFLVNGDENVTTGGIVGSFDETAENSIQGATISGSLVYGDVFVIYPEFENGKYLDKKLNSYVFGGIVGSAQKDLTIENCISLLTNFEKRGIVNAKNAYVAGAIVGLSGGNKDVNYSGNKYSSGVTMTIQEEDGNTDYGYGVGAYQGYTTATDAKTESAGDILASASVSIPGIEEGHKLKPYTIKSSNRAKDIKDISGSLNNIKWAAITENLQDDNALRNSLTSNLTNTAIVGNGRNVERVINEDYKKPDNNETPVYAGGIVDSMGTSYDTEKPTVNKPNFNLISGLIVDLDVNANIPLNNARSAFGGVTGYAVGNSFIYGVGVKGELSVGGGENGRGTTLRLAGIVGDMRECRLEQSYVDADISYRGGDDGCVSGIANLVNLSSTIKSTYSSGKIISYVDANVYTFASVSGRYNDEDTGIAEMRISDCYSITQVERNNVLNASSNFDGQIGFVGDGVSTNGQLINGTAEVTSTDYEYTQSDKLALSYSESLKKSQRNIFKPTTGTAAEESENTWYFSRLTNYGYASHGFGYLKNSTTYTYDEKNEKYEPVDYATLLQSEDTFSTPLGSGQYAPWYLGVPSVSKFDQMIDTAGNPDTDFKFILRYGFSLQNSKYVGEDSKKQYTVSSVGNGNFVLDGGENTIDLSGVSMHSGLFNVVNGNIRNLRLINGDVLANSESVGLLASTINGDIENVTAIGNIEINSGVLYAGGIVGNLDGAASKVESLVNITNETENTIIGGVVGKLKKGTISYASSTGILKNNPTDTNDVDSKTVKTIKIENGTTISDAGQKDLNAITGGVVGYVVDGKVSNAYNANSVLSNFTKSKDAKGGSFNVVSGGVVGYADKVTIENSYNASLVGAGNYNSTGKVLYAGGIVGYAGVLTMKNCVNDGPVQALGKVKSDNYNIVVEKMEGAETIETATANPSDLRYKIRMVYNSGDFREVNAYGLGYSESSANIENSQSTTNNVKNDGNVGSIWTESYLIFNRSEMLDGAVDESGKELYVGSFKTEVEEIKVDKKKFNDANLKISGYDSYGFPSRVYGIDNITRSLSTSHPFAEYIKRNVSQTRIETGYWHWDIGNWTTRYNGVATYNDEDGSIAISSSKTGGSSSFYSGEGDYQMSIPTDYYSSSILSRWWGNEKYFAFDGYDGILKHLNSYEYAIGKEMSEDLLTKQEEKTSNSMIETESKTIVDFVNTSIKSIDDVIERDNLDEELKVVNISGETVAIAKNSAHVTTILTPFSKVIGKQTFDLTANKDDIDWSSITKDSVKFEGAINPQFVEYNIRKNEEAGTVEVIGTGTNAGPKLYFASRIDTKISVKLDLRSKVTSFVLSDDNSELDDEGNLIVTLSKIFKDTRDKLTDTETYTLVSSEIADRTGLTTELIEAKTKLKVGGLSGISAGELNGQVLKIYGTEKYYIPNAGVVKIDSSTSSASQYSGLKDLPDADFNFAYKNYVEETKTAFPLLSEFAENDSNFEILHSDFFSALGLDSTKAFVYEIKFSTFDVVIYWDGSSFAIESTGVNVVSEGGLLKVSGDDASDFIDGASSTTSTFYIQSNINATADSNNPSSIVNINDVEAFDGLLKFNGQTETQKGYFKLYSDLTPGYEGNETDFTNENSDAGVNVYSPIKVGGNDIILRNIDVTFSCDFEATVDETKFASNESLKLDILKDGNLVGTEYLGGYLRDGDRKLNVKLGEVLSLTKITSSLPIEDYYINSPDGKVFLRDLTFDNSSDDLEYTVTQGVDSILGFENQKYIVTSKIMRTNVGVTTIEHSYDYKIWGNGIIEVDYKKTVSGEGEDSVNYIYLPMSISAGNYDDTSWDSFSAGYYKYQKIVTTQKSIIDGEEVDLYLTNYHNLNMSVNPSDLNGAKLDGKTITADFISLGFDDQNIFVIKDGNSNIGVEVTYMKEMSKSFTALIEEISCGNMQEKDITIEVADINSGNITYYKDYEEKTPISENSWKFTEFGTYEVSWTATALSQETKLNENSCVITETSNSEVDTVLLASDISMDGTKNGVSKKIVGTNYIMRFVSSGSSMLGDVQEFIKNTVFAGVNSGTNATSLFASEISGETSNLTLFGSIRNVSAGRTDSVYADYISGTNVNIASIVTLTGLNAENDKSVDVTLKAKVVDGDDKLVIVSGDAVKGENAKISYNAPDDTAINKDKNQRIQKTTTQALSGTDGKDGKKGGLSEIETQIGKNDDIICYSGYSSIGGFGGDGAHGTFNIEDIAVGGGAGGKAGANGIGTPLRNEKLTQLGGNGGLGGFGRIEQQSVEGKDKSDPGRGYNFIMYTSGNGGSEYRTDIEREKLVGSNGKAIKSASGENAEKVISHKSVNEEVYSSKKWVGYDGFFAVLISKYCSNASSGYRGKWDYGKYEPRWDYWQSWVNEDIKTKVEDSDNKFGELGGRSGSGAKSGSGNYVYVKNFYVFAQINVNKIADYTDVRHSGFWYKISWPSGETVNGAGACGLVVAG